MNDTYFNTTNAKERELKEYRRRSRTSTGECYRLFKEYAELSPWQAYGLLWYRNGKKELYPITSIRRAFNTLDNDGLIRRTNRKRIAKKTGAREYLYRIIN